jgi:hypothetical protein
VQSEQLYRFGAGHPREGLPANDRATVATLIAIANLVRAHSQIDAAAVRGSRFAAADC